MYDHINLTGKLVTIQTVEGDRIEGQFLGIEHPSSHFYTFLLHNHKGNFVFNAQYVLKIEVSKNGKIH